MSSSQISARSIQSATRAQLAAPLVSQDAILDILIPTLDLLNFLPEQGIPPFVYRKHAAAEVFGIAKDEIDDGFRIAFRSRNWLQDVQQAILGPIARDWAPRLVEDGLWEPLLQAWFAPQLGPAPPQKPSAGLISVIAEPDTASGTEERPVSAALVTASGVQVFISTLSSLTMQQGAAPSILPPTLADVFSTLISCYAGADFPLLDRLMAASLAEQNLARQKLVWQESMQAILSWPTRVANALKGDVPPSVTTSVYFANLASQLADQIAQLADSQQQTSDGRSDLLSQLVSKLLRAGQINLSFWDVVVRSLFKTANEGSSGLTWPAPYSRAWQKVLLSLEDSDREAFDQSLLAFLDQRSRLKGLYSLVTSQERGKPAIVGQTFLGPDTTRIVETQTRLLKLFWGGSTDAADHSRRSAVSDDDDDDDDEEMARSDRVRSYMLDERQQYTPAMARTFAAVLFELDPQGLNDALFEAIDVWGNAARVKRSTITQEQCGYPCPRLHNPVHH